MIPYLKCSSMKRWGKGLRKSNTLKTLIFLKLQFSK